MSDSVRPSRGHSEQARDIPKAAVYVAMTDRFMSRWGPAEGLRNRHIILCDDWTTAVAVAERAEGRPEMSRVTLSRDRPRGRGGVLFSWSGPDGWLGYSRPVIQMKEGAR